MDQVSVKDLMNMFELPLVCGEQGIGRHILTSDISRPGLEMAGYFHHYPAERIQLLGKSELSFFNTLSKEEKAARMHQLCAPETPAIIVSHDMEVPPELVVASEKNHVPVLTSTLKTTRVSSMVTNYLESRLAPMTAVHGVLVDIYGIGVLLTGKSGVGKSETALELVKKGHRLVADDCVEIRQESENMLVGNPPKLIEHMLEIRGIGLINIMTMFGASAVRRNKRISLVIDLELWDAEKAYDRLGLESQTMKILDTELTKLTIPVRPGRNLAVIIEVAAMDYRLKNLGINSAEEFTERLENVIHEKSEM